MAKRIQNPIRAYLACEPLSPDLTHNSVAMPQAGRDLAVRSRSDQPVSEAGVPASGAFHADGLAERPARSHHDDQALGPGDRRVEQVPLQHHPCGSRQRNHHRRIFRPLRPMDGHGIGVGEFVQFVEAVVDALVLVGQHGQLVVLGDDRGHHADGAVEHRRRRPCRSCCATG